MDRSDGVTLQRGVLRSRSLWDAELQAPADQPADGQVHVHEVVGPGGAALLLVERTVRIAAAGGPGAWRLLVAADRHETTQAVERFNGVLAWSLAALLGLLLLAAAAQVSVGLAPLKALQQALIDVREGRRQRLQGRFPLEVQPLVDDFNGVLERNAEVVARARTQAGNLAHALKTPLAAMAQAAGSVQRHPAELAALPGLVAEQVEIARRHVHWHLARSRAAAAQGVPGMRAEVAPVVHGLVRVMSRVHGERGLRMEADAVPPGLAFADEVQDLQEMLGNLLDNACKWAHSSIRLSAAPLTGAGTPRLRLVVEDDGPGIAAKRHELALARGCRLDEATPGSGLGLAIVRELADLYGGQMSLACAELGGLKVELLLPRASISRAR
ncbi:sensor histidine kinase [Azohydromonas australica]|uniref:sensor histidine kinase n=1 Tax=Azohydromonas australica TaxID=364039 RepID=UPI0004061B31|nr:ATP-binding protein [Azohydromonas australica]